MTIIIDGAPRPEKQAQADEIDAWHEVWKEQQNALADELGYSEADDAQGEFCEQVHDIEGEIIDAPVMASSLSPSIPHTPTSSRSTSSQPSLSTREK
jgi:hypothetical protein